MQTIPWRVRLLILGVLTLVSTLLWAVPGAVVLAGWPGLAPGGWWVVGGVVLVQLVTMLLANGRSHLDSAGAVSHLLLGLGWLAFSWSVLTLALHPFLPARTVALVMLAAVAVVGAYGLVEAFRRPRVRRAEVRLDGLDPAFDGLCLAMVSDTHFDVFTSPATGRRLVRILNGLDADVVVHCGDLADGSVAQRREHVAPLAEVSAPTRAYIAGNHEYYSDADGWRAVMAELGWDVLDNAHVVLSRGSGRLVLAGLDDPTGTGWGHGPDVDAALAGAPAAPVVMLAHQPHQVRDLVDRADLVLSGHTHGGQIWPFHLLVRLREPVLHGLTRHGDRTQLWVSRGAGFWGPPFRVLAPSDVSLLTLWAV